MLRVFEHDTEIYQVLRINCLEHMSFTNSSFFVAYP